MKLNSNPGMITVMETDLTGKIQAAISADPDLNMVVYGIFSIDDLEAKLESDLGGRLAVGVQYVGCQRSDSRDSRDGSFAAGSTNTIRPVTFTFQVVLAVPTTQQNADTPERHDATKLLTVIRSAIMGKPIDNERTARPWDFVKESPQLGASSATMLYYSQVWQVALQNLGTAG